MFPVEPEIRVTHLGVTLRVVALALQRQIGGRGGNEEGHQVEAGTVGSLAALYVETGVEEAAAGQREPRLAVQSQGLAVGDLLVDGVEIGDMGPVSHIELGAHALAVQNQVDHAADGVGTVLRAGTVTQHFHVVNGIQGQRVEVHRRRAAADLGLAVHHRGGMAAFAVDEHQHLVGAQAAQLAGAHVVGGA